MALTVSNASTVGASNPTASLNAALTEFENTLNADQKQQYRTTSTKPDTTSVITFVKIVDQNTHGKARSGVATRLITFLSALQQFTGVVDTFVSFNPAVAALVWGGVKTTILAASNVGRYFVEVTKKIMDTYTLVAPNFKVPYVNIMLPSYAYAQKSLASCNDLQFSEPYRPSCLRLNMSSPNTLLNCVKMQISCASNVNLPQTKPPLKKQSLQQRKERKMTSSVV